MASSGSRDQFLRQMEQIVEGIKQNRMKVWGSSHSFLLEPGNYVIKASDNNCPWRSLLCEVQIKEATNKHYFFSL